MKMKKLWDLGLTVAVIVFVYLLVSRYFPDIIYIIKSVIYTLFQDISNFFQSI